MELYEAGFPNLRIHMEHPWLETTLIEAQVFSFHRHQRM